MAEAKIQKLRKDMLVSDDDGDDYVVFPVTLSDAVVVRMQDKEDITLSKYLEQLNVDSDIQSQINEIKETLNPIEYSLTCTPTNQRYTGKSVSFIVNASVKRKNGTPLSGYTITYKYQYNDGNWVDFSGNLTVTERGKYKVKAIFSKDGVIEKELTAPANRVMYPISIGFTGATTAAGLEISELSSISNGGNVYACVPPAVDTLDNAKPLYLWIVCDNMTNISRVTHNGFDVDLLPYEQKDNFTYKCWRSVNKISPGNHTFNIE